MQTTRFQSALKTAYSHGLENIYALENVDPGSIRPFRMESSIVPKSSKKSFKSNNAYTSPQLCFDFGVGFRNWITPFFLDESVDVLELNKMEKKLVEDQGFIYLKDLLGINFNAAAFRGIGQAHWVEIHEKLNRHIGSKSLSENYVLDVDSFIRVICEGVSKKKAYLFLEPYGLNSLISLLPSESLELKRMSQIKQNEIFQEVLKVLKSQKKIEYVNQKVKEITQHFLIPWMEKRSGLATSHEILEYLEIIAVGTVSVEQLGVFLSDIYYSSNFPFEASLYPISQGLYASDSKSQSLFHTIESTAMSYFYRDATTYPLEDLVHWLEKEFVKKWIGFPSGWIQKVLSLSPLFYLWKNTRGFIEIKIQ